MLIITDNNMVVRSVANRDGGIFETFNFTRLDFRLPKISILYYFIFYVKFNVNVYIVLVIDLSSEHESLVLKFIDLQ